MPKKSENGNKIAENPGICASNLDLTVVFFCHFYPVFQGLKISNKFVAQMPGFSKVLGFPVWVFSRHIVLWAIFFKGSRFCIKLPKIWYFCMFVCVRVCVCLCLCVYVCVCVCVCVCEWVCVFTYLYLYLSICIYGEWADCSYCPRLLVFQLCYWIVPFCTIPSEQPTTIALHTGT